MKKYIVREVQEVIATYEYTWEVEAESEADALEKCRCGDGRLSDSVQRRMIGNEDFGKSGWGVDTDDDTGTDAAIDDFESRL